MMITQRFSIFLFLLLFSGYFAVETVQAQSESAVRTTDLLKIKQIGSVVVSPDGNRFVYVLREILEENDDFKYSNQLWMGYSNGSRSPARLTYHKDGASQPAWHPDGSKIAFTRPVDGKSQIFVLPLDGGESEAITNEEKGASSPIWSPDGRYLLYSVSWKHAEVLALDQYKNGPEWPSEKPGDYSFNSEAEPDPDGNLDQIRAWLHQNESSANPAVLNRLHFQGEFNLNPEVTYTHWYLLRVDSGEPARQLTSGFFSFSGATWSPDSRSVYFSGNMQRDENPERITDMGLYKISLADYQLKPFTQRINYRFTNPVFSPDGRFLAFNAFDNRERGYNQNEIAILDTRNGEISLHGSSIDRSFGNLKWSRDSRFVYTVAPTNGGFPLYRLDARAGTFERLTDLETGIRDYDVSTSRIIFAKTSIDHPYELYHSGLDGASALKLSSHNSWIQNREISRPVRHTVMNDDLEIEYWVMKPSGYQDGETYPVLLQIHGGPSAMWGPGEVSMWHEFQLFAAHGFGIVYSNPRGSGGYGYDFQKANHQDWGDGPMRDVLAALDDATSRYNWMDTDQLVVTGGSYGGYLVAYLVAMDHRFKAAAAQRGVYDLSTFFGEGNAWRLVPDRFGGYPWDDETYQILRKDSPFTFVDQIQTPLLILHGSNDLRTGVSQSEMMYRSLKVLERDVEYIRYPGAGHDLSRTGNPKQRLDRLLRMIEFMKRYVD